MDFECRQAAEKRNFFPDLTILTFLNLYKALISLSHKKKVLTEEFDFSPISNWNLNKSFLIFTESLSAFLRTSKRAIFNKILVDCFIKTELL